MTDKPMQGPVSVDGLVAYQPDSVVSRTLLSNQAGNVTLFAFDQGQRLSEHTAPYDALVLGVEGELDITIAGQSNRVNPGEALLMPANRPHAVVAMSASKMLLIMIRG